MTNFSRQWRHVRNVSETERVCNFECPRSAAVFVCVLQAFCTLPVPSSGNLRRPSKRFETRSLCHDCHEDGPPAALCCGHSINPGEICKIWPPESHESHRVLGLAMFDDVAILDACARKAKSSGGMPFRSLKMHKWALKRKSIWSGLIVLSLHSQQCVEIVCCESTYWMSNKGTMQLILSTAERAPRCSELLVSHGEPLLRLHRFGETQFGLHELGSLDDVAMTDFSPMKMWIGRIRPAAKMPCSPFEQRPNLFRVIHKVSPIRLCAACSWF